MPNDFFVAVVGIPVFLLIINILVMLAITLARTFMVLGLIRKMLRVRLGLPNV